MGTTKQDVRSEGVSSAPRHSEEFKRDAVRLVTEEGYTFAAAAKADGLLTKGLGHHEILAAIRRVLDGRSAWTSFQLAMIAQSRTEYAAPPNCRNESRGL